MLRKKLFAAAMLLGAVSPAFAAAPDAGDIPGDPPAVTAERQRQAVRLNVLFEQLQATSDQGTARAIERDIIAEWLNSGDAAADALMLKAILMMSSGELKGALGILDVLCDQYPRYVEAWNKRATLHFMLHDYERSIADIDKTLALEPRHFGALAGLGMIRRDQGDPQAALEAFERAYAVDPALQNLKQVIEDLRAELRGI